MPCSVWFLPLIMIGIVTPINNRVWGEKERKKEKNVTFKVKRFDFLSTGFKTFKIDRILKIVLQNTPE